MHADAEPPVAEAELPGAVIYETLQGLELGQSQPPIYDGPIGLRLLYLDPTSGAEHYLVEYPPGLKAQRHRHTVAHTIIALEGALAANGQMIRPGGYCHFPAGQAMHHEPAAGERCLFVTIFHGPCDVEVVDD